MERNAIESLNKRVERLERRLRSMYLTAAVMAAVIIAGLLAPAGVAQQNSAPWILRARAVVIEDEHGRERIVIGAPVPDPKEGKRRSASTGLVINDANGYERFGLGANEDGSITMGFDAPPGTGDPRNRERINIRADEKGGAYIRFLNRKTQAAGFLRLDDQDQFFLDILNFTDGKIVRRRLSFKGEERIEQKQ